MAGLESKCKSSYRQISEAAHSYIASICVYIAIKLLSVILSRLAIHKIQTSTWQLIILVKCLTIRNQGYRIAEKFFGEKFGKIG